MALRANLISNYFAKIYTAILAVAVVPFYLRLLGLEAYGVVGFYLMLMALMQLLDVGLSSTLSRQVALLSVGKIDGELVRYTLKVVFFVFVLIAIWVSIIVWFSAAALADSWFDAESLSPETLQLAIVVMGFTLGARWVCGPLRSVLVGSERLVTLNIIVIIVASLRYLLVIPILNHFSSGQLEVLVVFFLFQLFVALFECLTLFVCAQRCMRFVSSKAPPQFFSKAKPIFMFALAAAASSWMWIVIMQLDKLVLSKWLPLKVFGAFAAAMTAASAVQMLSAPLVQAIMPRLAKLHGQKDQAKYLYFFDSCIRKYAIYFSPVPGFIAFFSRDILLVWTANPFVAQHAALPLTLYTLAFWVVSIASFYYYLQHSSGQLRLHNQLLVCMLIYTVIAIVGAAFFYGAVGTGIAWLVMAISYLCFGGRLVLRRFHVFHVARWLLTMVLPYALLSMVLMYLGSTAYRNGLVTGISLWTIPLDLCLYFVFCSAIAVAVGRFVERKLTPGREIYAGVSAGL